MIRPTHSRPSSLAEALAWLRGMPSGTSVPAASVAEWLEEVGTTPAEPESRPALSAEPPATWRERLWTVPPETRLGIEELSEAINKSASWIYKRTGQKSLERIPCRRSGGELVFIAGEIRSWIRQQEEVIEPGMTNDRIRRIG